MKKISKLPLSVLRDVPAADKKGIHAEYEREWQDFRRRIIVLDDDPTGVQTVHGVDVYTDWSKRSLAEGFADSKRMFFVLTNSRSLTEQETIAVHQELTENCFAAAGEAGERFLLVSRGDSTLRGHVYPELETMRRVAEQHCGRKVDGQIICPFFPEGGRYTIDSVHYVREGEWLVPAGETEFAGDKTFGYHSSHLGEYVEEKSGGRCRAADSIYITLKMLRQPDYEGITGLLSAARDFQPVIVDAVGYEDLEVFAACLLRAMKTGREYLLRCAAALPRVLGNIGSRPLLTYRELTGSEESRGYGGLVLIGSHVKKTTDQLAELKQTKVPTCFLEFDVNTCFEEDGMFRESQRLIRKAEEAMAAGKCAVIYTSRKLLAPAGMDKEEVLRLSVSISDALTRIVGGLRRQPGFLVAKGGITSSDVGTKALKVRKALVTGQVQPGVPVWRTGRESIFPGLSYIIFPGNVGETDTLRKVVELCMGRGE